MKLKHRLLEQLEDTPLADTHEHLLDESTRLAREHPFLRSGDWSVLLGHYVCDDLTVARASVEADLGFFDRHDAPKEKFALVADHWAKARNTGYGQALRRTLRGLYGVEDLTFDTVERVSEAYEMALKPGFYEDLLRGRCKITACQVNSFENPVFHQTDMPELLLQDISIADLISPFGNPVADQHFADHRKTTADWLELIDGYFDDFGPSAVAVKSNNAYYRRIDYRAGDSATAERAFRAFSDQGWISADQMRQAENFLFRHAVSKAAEHTLPVKLHTGYQAGTGKMSLSNVSQNAADLAELAKDFPQVNWVAFHIGYPYQHEFVALAKQFPNVYVDMCWAWIIDPIAAVQFLKSFLMAVPSNKLLTFGGDYAAAELVYGHAAMARRGIAQALAELVEEEWLGEMDARALIAPLAHGNAASLFRL